MGRAGHTIAERLGVVLHCMCFCMANAAHARWYLHLQGTADWSEMGTRIYTGSQTHAHFLTLMPCCVLVCSSSMKVHPMHETGI